MARPCCMRRIVGVPEVTLFKPAGGAASVIEHVILNLDEVEALRLADLAGLYQEQAAERMRISRPTFARIIERARRKVADALVHGKAIRIEGGVVTQKEDEVTERGDRVEITLGGEKRGNGRGRCGCGMRLRRSCPTIELEGNNEEQ